MGLPLRTSSFISISQDSGESEHLEENVTYVNEWKKALGREFRTRVAEARANMGLVKEHQDQQQHLPVSKRYDLADLGPDTASAREYAIVVAKSIAQRLQLTCGLVGSA